MENASKALIIAGTILIAIITISVFYYMFGQVSTLVGDTSTDTAAEELEDYNASFEAYNKKLMYGADVISVYNKAVDNNTRYSATSGDEYYVEILVSTTEGAETKAACKSLMSYPSIMEQEFEHEVETKVSGIKTTASKTFTFKTCTFKCIDVSYNSYGRVSAMYFAIVW